jgi:hypothetical protein
MRFLKLDKSYDLFLTMTWNNDNNHGISGHLYEIIEYYILLKDHFKVGILICEDMTWDTIEKAIKSKYNIDTQLINDIKNNTIFKNRPKFVSGKNILFVDGGFTRTSLRDGIVLSFDNIFSFRCSNKDFHYNLPYKNITLLQDKRVYNDEDNKIAIDYKKKIKFDIYNSIKKDKTETALLYITTNCRKLCDDYLLDVIMNYKFEKYIILTNQPDLYKDKLKDFQNISFPEMPLENIFEKFDTYIYTPTYSVTKKELGCFDCSPRFIAECKFYSKEVIYHDIDEQYLDIDTGLKYRKYDIENNFESIILKNNDKIVDIIRNEI